MAAGRKPVRTAKEVLEQMTVSAQKSDTAVTPYGVIGDMLHRNAETVMDPERCDSMVETLLVSAKEVATTSELSTAFGVADVGALLVHPYFLRAAARRGFVFYIGADGAVHRQTFAGLAKAVRAPIVTDGPVDPSFYAEPTWFPALTDFIKRDCPVLLIGPAGAGKSEAVERVFAARKQTLQIVSCTPAMSADDFEGRVDLRGGETVFTHSAAAIAVQHGHGLLLDEADAAPAEACYSLYRALTGKDMRIARQGYDGVVTRHPSFRCVGTQNTEGRGDDRGLYHGRSHQDEAFLDRWANYIRVDYPHPDVEAAILTRRTGLPKKHAEKVVRVATELRKALTTDRMMLSVTLRRVLAVAGNIVAGFSPEDSWRFAVQNRATPEDAQVISDLVNRVCGSAAKKPIS